VEELEGEVKEKSAIIGKLRHQNVILNEHLTEALRRLGREKGEGVVDRYVALILKSMTVH
jgi:hypothetical protein